MKPKYDAYAALVANMVISGNRSCNRGFDETANHDELIKRAAEKIKMTPDEFQQYAWEYAKGG